jgi:AcrR family transcriptional regulator
VGKRDEPQLQRAKDTAGRARLITRELPEVRREELMVATLRCLAELGPIATSVRAIAREAGVSPSLITYHFGTKSELVAAAYEFHSQLLGEATAEVLDRAGDDPSARLSAFFRIGFDPRFLNEEYITARFLFWGLARTDEHVGRIHADINTRYRRDLGELVEGAVGPTPDRDALIFSLSALLDGLWLEWMLDARGFDPDGVVSACWRVIHGYRGVDSTPATPAA